MGIIVLTSRFTVKSKWGEHIEGLEQWLTLSQYVTKMLVVIIAKEGEAQRGKSVCPRYPLVHSCAEMWTLIDMNLAYISQRSGIGRSFLPYTWFLRPLLACSPSFRMAACGLQSSDQRAHWEQFVEGCWGLGKGNKSQPSPPLLAATEGRKCPRNGVSRVS